MCNLLIVGAGGHGKVVADTARSMGKWEKLAFVDDRYREINSISGIPVIGELTETRKFLSEFPYSIVAIGCNLKRLDIQQMLETSGFSMAVVMHPTAVIGSDVQVGSGTAIFAHAVINTDTVIGEACIINTGATIDHDCTLKDGVHISPGAHLAGGVSVGARSWIGIGAAVIQNCSIGDDVIVGAGAAVINDVKHGLKVAGIPASPIGKNR